MIPVFHQAITHAECSQAKHVLVVDMREPSSKKRAFLIDMSGPFPVIEGQAYVAHGAGSDPNKDGLALRFGDKIDSYRTSLGWYRIEESYYGVNGLSYRLKGLSLTNKNAWKRNIMLHPAPYVRKNGHIGRSNGCVALNPKVFKSWERQGYFKNAYVWVGNGTLDAAHCYASHSTLRKPRTCSPWWSK